MYNVSPKQRVDLTDYLSFLREYGQAKSFEKGECVIRHGDESNKLYFLERGLVKCYQLHQGKEVILRLMTDNSAVLAYSGFITASPSTETIECLLPCSGYWLSLDVLLAQLNNEPRLDAILRYIAEQHYLSMERRLVMLHHKSAVERYRYFLSNMESRIVKETPMHCVASYLGITPESFSRMKRSLNN